jgi:hypothetical protein
MQSGSNRHYMPPVSSAPPTVRATIAAAVDANAQNADIGASASKLSQQRNQLLQQHMPAVANSSHNTSSTSTSSQSNNRLSSSAAPGLHQHDASSALMMGMGGGLFGGGGGGMQAPSQRMDAMYYNNNASSFGHPGMFGPGGGLAAASQPLGSFAASASASAPGDADQALAYEHMVANQQRASNLEAEFRLQQRWNNPQQQHHTTSNYNNYNMGPGAHGGVGLVGGMPGGMPNAHLENAELARLLLMRDQLERKKNGEL